MGAYAYAVTRLPNACPDTHRFSLPSAHAIPPLTLFVYYRPISRRNKALLSAEQQRLALSSQVQKPPLATTTLCTSERPLISIH